MEPDLPQCCFWACRGWWQPASFLLLCQAIEKALGGCLLCSHYACAMPSSHFWSSCWQARLPFVYELSRCLGGSGSSFNLVPRLRDFESFTAPGLCPGFHKRKAEGPFFLTWNLHLPSAFVQAAMALLWAQ